MVKTGIWWNGGYEGSQSRQLLLHRTLTTDRGQLRLVAMCKCEALWDNPPLSFCASFLDLLHYMVLDVSMTGNLCITDLYTMLSWLAGSGKYKPEFQRIFPNRIA
jgi:hypothetical protein